MQTTWTSEKGRVDVWTEGTLCLMRLSRGHGLALLESVLGSTRTSTPAQLLERADARVMTYRPPDFGAAGWREYD